MSIETELRPPTAADELAAERAMLRENEPVYDLPAGVPDEAYDADAEAEAARASGATFDGARRGDGL